MSSFDLLSNAKQNFQVFEKKCSFISQFTTAWSNKSESRMLANFVAKSLFNLTGWIGNRSFCQKSLFHNPSIDDCTLEVDLFVKNYIFKIHKDDCTIRG